MSSCCNCCRDTPVPDNCRATITSADLAELLYVQGLDENLCVRFQEVADLLQLRDCAGNPIVPNAQIVTCADFPTRLCAALSALVDAGSLTLGVTEVVGSDCQTYTVPETPITPVDTLTVDLTVGGPFSHTLQADVRISGVSGNEIEVLPDGLYVDALNCADLATLPNGGPATPGVTQVVGADCIRYTLPAAVTPGLTCEDIGDLPTGGPVIPDVTLLLGADCQLHTIPAGTDFTVVGVDSATVDMTVTEAPANQFNVSAQVIASPNAGNAVTILPNGVYVADTTIQVQDTDCLDLEVVEGAPNQFTLTGNILISPEPNNGLECRATGLFANIAEFDALDTSCINLTLIGGELTATPIISPTPGNQLQCTGTGLYVPAGAGVTVDDTPSVNLTIINNEITADVNISTCAGNLITIEPDGLCVQAAPGFVVGDTDCIELDLTAGELTATPIIADAFPGYGAGCNGLQCTVNGLAVAPDHTTLQSSATSVPPDGTIDSGITTTVADIQACLTNTSTCRQLLTIIDYISPQLTIAAPVEGTTNVYMRSFVEINPGPVIVPETLIYQVNIAGPNGIVGPGSADIDTGGGPLIYPNATLTLDPGEQICVSIRIELENFGSRTETYILGNVGVRVFGSTI